MSNPYHVSDCDRDGFDQLVEQLSLKQPYGGYTNTGELPRLKSADLATVMRGRPGLLDDFILDHRDIADILEGKCIHGGVSVGEYLSAELLEYANRTARRELFEALQERQETVES